MVNVVSQIPFNLHKPPPNRLPHPHHSRSRSLSASVSSEYLPHHHDPFSSSSRHRSYTYYTSAPPPTSRFYSDPSPYTLSTIHSSPLGYPSEDIDYADADTGGPKYVFGAHIVHDRDRPPNPRGNSKAPRRGRSTNSRYLHLPDMPSSSSNSLGTGTPPEYRSDEEDDDGGEGFQEEEEGDEGDDTPQPRSRRARQHKDILNLKDSGAITFSWGDSPVRG